MTPNNDSIITFRSPQSDDVTKIFSWRNLREMVARASEQRPIEWDEHTKWFAHVTTNENYLLWMICLRSEDIGVIRFDRQSWKEAVISIYILPDHTGHGLGVTSVRLGCGKAFKNWDIDRIYANIRTDNRPGIVAFERAGFQPVTDKSYQLPSHVTRVYTRER